MGLCVGLLVGFKVGACVGWRVGEIVGINVEVVGGRLSLFVGNSVVVVASCSAISEEGLNVLVAAVVAVVAVPS